MTESCANYYCQDGLQVYFATETQEYTYIPIYGHYELQTNDVNGRPYFQMKHYGLYFDGIDTWYIGTDAVKGQSLGFAIYNSDVFCPHQLSDLNWLLFDGTKLTPAEKSLGIRCKCIFIQTQQIMNFISSKNDFS